VAVASPEEQEKLRCASPSRIEQPHPAQAQQSQLAPVSSPKPTEEEEEEIKRL
jgi:hypothetical protein